MSDSHGIDNDATQLNRGLAEAARLLRSTADLEDIEVHKALVDRGFDYVVAARIVEFMPSAFAHVFFANTGVQMSSYFQRMLPDGRISESRALNEEPIWRAVLAFAHSEIATGVSKEDFMLLTMRSAEFQGVNEMLNRGSKLENLVMTPTLLPWPETGPN
jgi:hypothetical protein